MKMKLYVLLLVLLALFIAAGFYIGSAEAGEKRLLGPETRAAMLEKAVDRAITLHYEGEDEEAWMILEETLDQVRR